LPRYFAVELLTGVAFLSCWLAFGGKSAAVIWIFAGKEIVRAIFR
jgi:prepilin signal peptidase PulO-like enzyme (type II secretory pathway)